MWYKYKKYIEENEEIRCWFKVSSNRKKVWNIQLGLIEEVKRICKKHGLKYYADSWTLLWAIRHKWFIPRDDDTDIIMLREDYDKFMEIAPKELHKPYILQSNFCSWFAKLRNESTLALDDYDRDVDYLGGISLDIFPLDYMSKYKIINFTQNYILIFVRWILISLKYKNYFMKVNIFKKIFWHVCRFIFWFFNYNKIYLRYDNFCKKTLFVDKLHVVDRCECFQFFYDIKDLKSISEVDFENIKICIPQWYDNILRRLYWDYSNPVIWDGGHNCLYSTEKWYKEIIQNWEIDVNKLFNL